MRAVRGVLNRRAQDIKRKFGSVLDLGSGPGHFARLLDPETAQKVVMLDSSGTPLLPLPVVRP